MIKLLASDMDGTLLDENGKVPEETFELIRELRKKGVIFAASSGRRYSTLRKFFEPVANEMDYVAALGAEVYADGKLLLDREVFSHASVLKLCELCASFDCLHIAVYDETRTYLLDDLSSYVREVDKDLPNAERVDDPPTADTGIIKISVCCERTDDVMDMAYVLEREMGDLFSFMPSGSKWIDVTPSIVNKATGLDQLLRYRGIDPSEVMCFGDSMNDYHILRHVGYPMVMANARYAVRQTPGARVIDSNAAHGVQQVMRELLESL